MSMISVIYSIPVTRDFIGGSRSVMLDTSTSTVCVDVDIIDDAVPEVSQHFEILFDPLLVLPKLRFGRTQRAEVTILDNDGKYTSWDIFIIGILCVYICCKTGGHVSLLSNSVSMLNSALLCVFCLQLLC